MQWNHLSWGSHLGPAEIPPFLPRATHLKWEQWPWCSRREIVYSCTRHYPCLSLRGQPYSSVLMRAQLECIMFMLLVLRKVAHRDFITLYALAHNNLNMINSWWLTYSKDPMTSESQDLGPWAQGKSMCSTVLCFRGQQDGVFMWSEAQGDWEEYQVISKFRKGKVKTALDYILILSPPIPITIPQLKNNDNIVITMYGVRWLVDLLGWSLCKATNMLYTWNQYRAKVCLHLWVHETQSLLFLYYHLLIIVLFPHKQL